MFKRLISHPNFGPSQDALWASEATIFIMGRPMAPQIGLEAIGARTKARSGSAHSILILFFENNLTVRHLI